MFLVAVCAIVGLSRGLAFRAALTTHVEETGTNAPGECPGECGFDDAGADEDPLPSSHTEVAVTVERDSRPLVRLERSPDAPATTPLDKPPAA